MAELLSLALEIALTDKGTVDYQKNRPAKGDFSKKRFQEATNLKTFCPVIVQFVLNIIFNCINIKPS